ncbi:MAG TPA: [protein-PII] uridylyltransferase [Polyangiaceae bacterium]
MVQTRAHADGVRAALGRVDAALEGALAKGEDGAALGRMRARLLDDVLAEHFAAACASVGVDVGRAPVVLAAAGSYGRGAMALRSDVDVRLLAVGKAGAARALADAILYPLWDAGLAVGHQLALPGEMLALAKDDLATSTTMFDLRAVAGDAGAVRALVEKFAARAKTRAAEMARSLAEDTRRRHERYGDSVYLLEPDVKLGAGGMRDIEVARWMLAPLASPGDPLAVLVAHGALDARELEAALAAESFAWRVRNRLHALAGRRSDRLTFDAQEALAVALGYGSSSEATERFMQDHYVHARAISRVRDRATSFSTRKRAGSRVRTKPIGPELVLAAGAVAFAEAGVLERDPTAALRAYAESVRLGAPLDEATRDAIARMTGHGDRSAALRASAEAAALFVDLVPEVARELHDVGLLLAMIPEFLPVTGRVHHDVYHVLTVDVHSVAAVDCLRQLARGDLSSAHPLASRLAAEIVRPRPLFLATLLHDVGKGHAAGERKNHSVSGAELCDVVLPRLGLDAEETADARALVLHHLAMYHLATRRDLDDPSTIEELCRIVRGREGLRDLYLLTVADITTTSPAAMTSWKAHMLEELYLRADARLAESTAPGRDDERQRAVRAAVGAIDPEAESFVATMPMRYVLATPVASIALHARLARARGERAAVVGLGPAHASRGESEVCVVARDRPGLLARIAAALAASRLEVSAAHIHTRASGEEREAVDVFFVRDPSGEESGVARKLAGVERDLGALCEERESASELVASRLGSRATWASRRTPDVPTKIVFDERTSPRHTIIEVFAKDRPGLLFRLSRAIEESGLGIALSKINTEGTKVADVFYVQELDGRKVEGKKRLDEIRARLESAIG